MKSASPSRCDRAFSLIELLVVIGIMSILAALLLPALSQAKARAVRIQCNHQLHQIGIGFVSFANDHNGKFPMAVPEAAGGSMEFATNGQPIPGEAAFSFRHFQSLSNELVSPRLVACPADTRLPAVSFAALDNSHVSYFVGVTADFSRPTTILAGDRNLTNDYATPGSLAQLGPNMTLRWTRELHQYKGNLLFSDGHTEEKSSAGLLGLAGQSGLVANLALPQVGPAGPVAGKQTQPMQSALTAAASVSNLAQLNSTNRLALGGRNPALNLPLFVPVPLLGALDVTSWQSKAVLATNSTAAGSPSKPELAQTDSVETNSLLAVAPARVWHTGGWWLLLLLLLALVVSLNWVLAWKRSSRSADDPPPRKRVRFSELFRPFRRRTPVQGDGWEE